MDAIAVELANKRKSTAIVKKNYLGRLITYCIGAIPVLFELYSQEATIGVWVYFIIIFTLFPHIAYFLAKRSESPQGMEIKNMFIEGFLFGVAIPLLSFSVLALITPILSILIYTTFYGGLSVYSKVLFSMSAGALFSCLLFEFTVDFSAGLWTNYAAILIIPLQTLGLVLNIRKDYGRSRDKLRKSKDRMEELATKLSKYLSPQVYSQIFLGQKEVRLESYRKKLTVFFSDIKGFTALTDSMESEALSSLLNNYFNEMAAIAIRHGGTIDKYMGDAIMIFFGDPETLGEKGDAKSCVLMALEMRQRLEKLRAEWKGQGIWSYE